MCAGSWRLGQVPLHQKVLDPGVEGGKGQLNEAVDAILFPSSYLELCYMQRDSLFLPAPILGPVLMLTQKAESKKVGGQSLLELVACNRVNYKA